MMIVYSSGTDRETAQSSLIVSVLHELVNKSVRKNRQYCKRRHELKEERIDFDSFSLFLRGVNGENKQSR